MSASGVPSHSSRSRARRGWWITTLAAIAAAGIALGFTAAGLGNDGDLGGTAAQGSPSSANAGQQTETDADAPGRVPSPAPAREINATFAPEDVEFTLVATGDILTHGPVVTSATTADGYDFGPLMSPVRDYVKGADLALCHLEVPVAPAGTKPSGYPIFGAPKQLVQDIANEGWDGCSTASNHSVDRGFAGLEATLDAFDDAGLGHAGTARTQDEADSVQMYRVRTGGRLITVAHIAYAYGLNGLPKPDGKPWSVNTFDADAADAQPIIDRAQQARDAGADVVIASVHCCVEYQTAPTDAQRQITKDIAASGLVDLYIGHHAHVPQPIELLPGGPSGNGMWTAFGLGNYLSNQDAACCVANSDSGILLTATFDVPPDGEVDVGVEWTAVTVDRRDHHTIHALRDISDGTSTLSASEVAARLKRVRDAAGPQAPERTEPTGSDADDAYRIPRGDH